MEIIIQLISIFIAGILCFLVRDTRYICYILAVCVIVLLIVSLIFHRLQQKRLDELIVYLMKIQDRLDLPELENITKEDLAFCRVKYINWWCS